MLLQIEGLQTGYGQVQVLWDVNIEVAEGEIVSLLGPNGAGKTSTLRAASGVLPRWGGNIVMDGTPLEKLSPEKRAARGLGHVPEGRGVLRSLTVEQNLTLGTGLRRDGRAAIKRDKDHLLDLFPALAGKLNDSAASLSGGQQQMLVLARALLTKPKLLVIDEMSFGLAPSLVNELFDMIKRLREEGGTFLLVEQNAGALRISDRAYVLSGGRTVASATPDELADSDTLVRSYIGGPADHGK